MTEFLRNLIGNDFFATIIMSFVPLIELKGGIVFARGLGYDFFAAFILAYLGSTIVVLPIYFLLRPILNLLKKIKFISKLAYNLENYFKEKADKVLEERKKKNENASISDTFLKQMGVFIFIAIPLPMTGIWSGTAIAVFLGLKFKDVILPAVLGNFVAGLLISLLAELCLSVWSLAALDVLLYGLFGLALILTIIVVIKLLLKKSHDGKTEGDK